MALIANLDKTRKDLEKTRKDLEKTITDRTPLYAFVGAGDLAVEKFRDARADLVAKIDAKALRDQAQAKVNAGVEAVQADVKAAPGQVKTFPTKAQALVNEYLSSAVSTYGDLAGRGKELVTRIRKQQATVDLEKQAKSTVSRAKATSTSAKKAAATTKSSAKATTTSAKKTASAAKTATGDAASKVGD